MKITSTTALLLLLSTAITSFSIPRFDRALRDDPHYLNDLAKRRGGGGHGGGGGGRGGGGGGRTGRGGTPSSGSSSSSSNVGGSTRSGSGRQPAYGGGSYYAGGAAVPYAAGGRSPSGIVPFLLPIGALAFFPGIWLYGAYAYPYIHHYNYTTDPSREKESLPVVCLCQQYAECGCDDNKNGTFYEDLFNGTEPKNSSDVRVVKVNGTETIYTNGTLANGTTVRNPNASSASKPAAEAVGYWMMVAVVVGTVWGL